MTIIPVIVYGTPEPLLLQADNIESVHVSPAVSMGNGTQ